VRWEEGRKKRALKIQGRTGGSIRNPNNKKGTAGDTRELNQKKKAEIHGVDGYPH